MHIEDNLFKPNMIMWLQFLDILFMLSLFEMLPDEWFMWDWIVFFVADDLKSSLIFVFGLFIATIKLNI